MKFRVSNEPQPLVAQTIASHSLDEFPEMIYIHSILPAVCSVQVYPANLYGRLYHFGQIKMNNGTKEKTASIMTDILFRDWVRVSSSEMSRRVFYVLLASACMYLAYNLFFLAGFRDKEVKRATIEIYNALELGMPMESTRQIYAERRIVPMTMRQLDDRTWLIGATIPALDSPIWSLGLTFESNRLVHVDIHDLSESNRMAVYRGRIRDNTIDPTGVEKGRLPHQTIRAVNAAAPQREWWHGRNRE